jgi:hypothetical protein
MSPDVAAVAAILHAFDGEVVDVRPRRGGFYHRRIGRWRRRAAPIVACADCATPTFARFAGRPYCHRCAWGRWTAWRLESWRRALA